jgi:hypothetical protein
VSPGTRLDCHAGTGGGPAPSRVRARLRRLHAGEEGLEAVEAVIILVVAVIVLLVLVGFFWPGVFEKLQDKVTSLFDYAVG